MPSEILFIITNFKLFFMSRNRTHIQFYLLSQTFLPNSVIQNIALGNDGGITNSLKLSLPMTYGNSIPFKGMIGIQYCIIGQLCQCKAKA